MIWDISSGDLRRLWKTTTNGPFSIAIAMLDYHGVYGI
jgi:hypothetical protein